MVNCCEGENQLQVVQADALRPYQPSGTTSRLLDSLREHVIFIKSIQDQTKRNAS